MEPIRVVLADDHKMILQGLASVLADQDGITVVGQASGGEAALRTVLDQQPDVLVMDYSMPDRDGASVTAEITQRDLGTQVLILTMHDNVHYVLEALAAGASGFVVKSGAADELVEAIRAVHAGQTYVSPELRPEVTEQLAQRAARRNGIARLSPREFELLRHLGGGKILQEAARAMAVTESTASTYRARIMSKLGLQNTAQIIRYAIENGIVD